MSQAGKLFDGTILPDIETITGNSGGAVGPTGGNINVVGDGTTINIAGNPGTSTLTANVIAGSEQITITGDTGGAQTSNTFTLAGGTTGLSFGGAADVFTTTFAGITANGGTVSLATDATASTINIGTGAGAKTSTFGSTNSTSATTVQSGSGALNVTSTNGALTVNSGTGALSISNDSSATTVNIATGAAVKTLTVGSTNSTSSTAINSGSGNIAMNSGFTVDSSGRWKSSVQPMFLVGENASPTNVTGDLTVYTVPFDTEVYDIGGNFASNTFTAPITGRYLLTANVSFISANVYLLGSISILTSIRPYSAFNGDIGATGYTQRLSVIADMTAGDTAIVRLQVGNGAKTIQIQGNTGAASYATYFSGMLLS